MDLHAELDELVAIIENARAMPMSASCVVNRVELLTHLDELRALLPTEIAGAREVISARNDVIEEGRREASRITAEAESERARLISDTEVVREAAREAQRLVAAARVDAERMRLEIDDYVDGKLANFEVVLHKTLKAVEKGREKISGRADLGSWTGRGRDDTPFPG